MKLFVVSVLVFLGIIPFAQSQHGQPMPLMAGKMPLMMTPGVFPGMPGPAEGMQSPGLQPPPRTPPGFPSPNMQAMTAGMFKAMNFTNSSSFSSSSSANAFSAKDFSTKIAQIDQSGKPIQRNSSTKEFIEQQAAESAYIADNFGAKKYLNSTTDFEESSKTQDGKYAQQSVGNKISESSGVAEGDSELDKKTSDSATTEGNDSNPETTEGNDDKETTTESPYKERRRRRRQLGGLKVPKAPTKLIKPKVVKKAPVKPVGKKVPVGKKDDDDDDEEEEEEEETEEATPKQTMTPAAPTEANTTAKSEAKAPKKGEKKAKKKAESATAKPDAKVPKPEEENDISFFTFASDSACASAFGGSNNTCTKQKWDQCRATKCPGNKTEPVLCIWLKGAGENIYKCHLECMRIPCGSNESLAEENYGEPTSKIKHEGKCTKKEKQAAAIA